MKTVLPWAIPEEDPEELPVREVKVQKLGPTQYTLSSIVLGDSTWKDLPREVVSECRRKLYIATPGGSIFTSNPPRPAAIIGLREALAQEDPARPLLMYAYPMQGSTRGDRTFATKHRNKTKQLGADHFVSKNVADYQREFGIPESETWEDSLHPAPAAQVYLREFAIAHADDWTRVAAQRCSPPGRHP